MALLFLLLKWSSTSQTSIVLHTEWRHGNDDVHCFIEHCLVDHCENFVRAFDFGTKLVMEVVASMQNSGLATVSLFAFICWARFACIGRRRLQSLHTFMMLRLTKGICSHEKLISVLGQWLLQNPLHVAQEPYSPWGYGMGLNAAYTQKCLERGLHCLETLKSLDLRKCDCVASKLISRFGNGRATPFGALQICMDARLVPELSSACHVDSAVPDWVAKPGWGCSFRSRKTLRQKTLLLQKDGVLQKYFARLPKQLQLDCLYTEHSSCAERKFENRAKRLGISKVQLSPLLKQWKKQRRSLVPALKVLKRLK
jgi:hypothetical protein